MHISLLLFPLAAAVNLPPLPPRLLFPSGLNHGDTPLTSQNAYHHEQIKLTPPMYFFNETVKTLTMTTNGVVFLNGDCPECRVPEPCANGPAKLGMKMVACFWADGDPSKGTGGLVSYRRSRNRSDVLAANQYLRIADNRISLALDKTELFIATWANVTSSGSNDLDSVNTFQCTLVTDGKESYVAFSYERLDWHTSYWSPGISPLMGLDNGQTACTNISLPYSNTGDAQLLLNTSNFASLPLPAATPAGQFVLGAGNPPKPRRPYSVPIGTRIATCKAVADPHYTSFDGQFIAYLFRPAITWVTQKQPANKWAIMAATTTCNEDILTSGYPPFAVQVLPLGPVGGVTNPGGLKVTFFMSTLRLYEDGAPWNKNLDIELYRDYFILNGNGIHKVGDWECRQICGVGSRMGVQYMIKVVKRSNGYAIETDFGFGASATPNSAVSVSIPDIPELKVAKFKLNGNTFGFCGNFDGEPQNDGWCEEPSLQTGDKYKECWQSSVLFKYYNCATPGYFKCPHYPDNVNYVAGRRRRHAATSNLLTDGPSGSQSAMRAAMKLKVGAEACAILLDHDGPFKPCQQLAAWTSYYDNCVGDVGEVNGDIDILCLGLKVAADACAAEIPDVRVAYRDPGTKCEVECGPNAHWEDLASGCPPTCDSPLAPQLCNQPSAGACVCDFDRLLMGQDCVLPSACTSCLGSGSTAFAIGESWLSSDCSQNCTCAADNNHDCEASACGANAACAANADGPYCVCKDGFFGDGYACSEHNYCAEVECQNGGFCVNLADKHSAECVCQNGWTGPRCESAVDACTSRPCGNGAECRNSFGGMYDCTCARGWDGPDCLQKLDPCSSFPCLNLATCIGCTETQTYTCDCAAGYTGHDCAFAIAPGRCPVGEVFYSGCVDPRSDPYYIQTNGQP